MKKALILLGCPELPIQAPMAVYMTWKLGGIGYNVTTVGTPSAIRLLDVSDPERFYIKNKLDVDSCIEKLHEGSFDLLIGFVHNDAAASYFVTFCHIINTVSISIITGTDKKALEIFKKDISKNTEAKIILERAYHNPTPLKVKFDKTIKMIGESDEF